jgi:predicted phosphoribosyltransferase
MSKIFESRLDAARRLAQALGAYKGRNPLVLAIPRGAVAMGAEIARLLEGELDVVLVKKLHAPGSPEFAVGAIDESGWTYIAPYAASAGADQAYLAREKDAELALLRRRRAQYTPARAPADPAGRVAIVVDDGIATGASMIAALHAVRAKQPARLVCAVPVAPAESLEQIRRRARVPGDARRVHGRGPVLPSLRAGRGRRGGRAARAPWQTHCRRLTR